MKIGNTARRAGFRIRTSCHFGAGLLTVTVMLLHYIFGKVCLFILEGTGEGLAISVQV